MFDKGRTNARLSIIAEQCASAALEVARQDYREYMAALKPGQTVELLADVELGEALKPAAGITIDGKGMTTAEAGKYANMYNTQKKRFI